MTVPTTNIGLSHIQTEFGGSNPISLAEYYAGGTYVPTGQTNNAATPVPTSGTISIGNFTGATKLALNASLPSAVSCITFTASNPSITLSNAGTWSTVGGGGSGTWKTGSGTTGDYQARASNLSGNTANATGTYNIWLTLSSSYTWGLTAAPIGAARSITFTLEIRMTASPNTVFTSSTVTLESDRT